MAQRAHADTAVREGLFAAMQGDDRREAFNAAWALTHLPASDNKYIDAHREMLVDFALATPDTSLRRLSLALLERLEWPVDAIRTDLLDFCLEHMIMAVEPYGIRALCIKLAYLQCHHCPELKYELRQGLLLMEPSELGAGVKHTRGKILKLL